MIKLLKILANISLIITPAITFSSFSYQENSIQDYQWKDPLGAEIKNFKLIETKKGELLKDVDKTKLNDEIVQVLIEANSLTNIPSKDIFTFNLSQVTPESEILWVNVQATLPTIDKPGLNAGTVKVVLDLTAKDQDQISPVQEITVSLQLNETKKTDEVLTENDRTRLEKTVLQALVKVNQTAANVNEKTFELEDLTKLTPMTNEINVTVQATKPTADKPGLTAGSVKVTLNLTPANQDPIFAKGVKVPFTLTETHFGEKLKETDKNTLHDEILKQLKEVNKNATIENDTFSFDLTNLVVKTSNTIKVNVKPTFSTPDKAGLKAGTINADLDIKAVLWSIPELLKDELEIKDAKSGDDAVNQAQVMINKISQLKGNVDLTKNAQESKIHVKANAQGQTSLTGEADFKYTIFQDQAQSPAEAVKVTLNETSENQEIKGKDIKLVNDAIINAVKTANGGHVINSDTFSVNLKGITPAATSVIVTVKNTPSTGELPGLKTGKVSVNVNLEAAAETKGDVHIPALQKIQLDETSESGITLKPADVTKVQDALIAAMKEANVADRNFDDQTFTPLECEYLTLDSKTVNIKVAGTEPKDGKAGLNPTNIEVDINLLPAKDQEKTIELSTENIVAPPPNIPSTRTVTIKNHQELENIKVNLADNLADVDFNDSTGAIVLTNFKQIGRTLLTVSASNAKSVSINVVVQELEEPTLIELDKYQATIKVNEETEFKITNYKIFKNLFILSEGKGNGHPGEEIGLAKVLLVDDTLKIKGVKPGNYYIRLAAINGLMWKKNDNPGEIKVTIE